LRFDLDVEQEWFEMTVKWWLADDDFFVLVICSGWPRVPDPDGTEPAPKGLTLANVYAIGEAGCVWKLGRGELPRFKRQALVEAGHLPKPPPYPLLPLPDGAPVGARISWEWIARVLANRRLTEPRGTPIALNENFLHRWSGGTVPATTFRSGKRWLEKRGFMMRAGAIDTGKPKPLILWAFVEPAADHLAESA
jgi:hypothetical protein